MLDNLVKSTTQLRYELEKTKNELIFLLENWEKKKESSAIKITAYRADLKELETVMRATEESYEAYLFLVRQNLTLADSYQNNIEAKIPAENYNPDAATWVMPMIKRLISETQAAEQAESARISRVRQVYKTKSEQIQRKSKESYLAMKEEKQNVEAYAVVLEEKIQALNEQLQLQIKTSCMGTGL